MRSWLIKAALAASTALATTSPSFAQGTGAAAGNPADIIVTARRTEERLQDVPISITVVNQEQLQSRNISNIGDLGTYVPSLSTNSHFGPEKASFAIRGFTQEQKTSPSVGVYFADVIGLRGNSGTGGGNGVGVGDLFDLQNVQVLKGPQGTLFGRNTTGGAVLLVPQRPTDRFEGYLEGTIGNYDMRRTQGVVNIPVSESLQIRAGADWQDRDGYLRNRSGIGPRRFGDVNYHAFRLSALLQLTPELENYTIGTYSNSRNNGTTFKLTTCDRNLAAMPVGFLTALGCAQIDRQNARGDGFYDVDSGIRDPRSDIRQWRLINTTTWDASDEITVKNIISYGEYRERASLSIFGENFQLAPGVPLTMINAEVGPTGNTQNQSTFTEELQVQGTSGPLTWIVGGYMEISKPIGFYSQYSSILLSCSDVTRYQCFDPIGAGSISLPNFKDSFYDYAGFAQASYQFNDRLSLTAGVRYTYDRQRTVAQGLAASFPTPNTPVFQCKNLLRFDSNPDPMVFQPVIVDDFSECELTFKQSSRKPTWLLSAEYKPNEDMLLYAKWARGYRAGGINAGVAGLETWGPEKVDTYEVGAKTSFRGALSGYFNVAAFYNDFSNQQLAANVFAAPGLIGISQDQTVVNAGKSRIWGIEVDSSLTPVEGLRFDLSYAYLNTKLKSLDVAASSPIYGRILPNALVGEPLALAPKNRLTIAGTYTLPLDSSIGEVSFGASYVYTSAQNAFSSLQSPLYRLPATHLVDANATWNGIGGTPIDASLFVTNLTKRKFPVFAIGSYPAFGFDGILPNQPRMYGLRLRYSFGESK